MDLRLQQNASAPWRVLLALVCVLLVLVAGIAQVAHTHADGGIAHADCSLCAAAHIAVDIVQTPAAAPSITVFARLETLPRAILHSALSTFALFTRPPPSDIVPA